MRSMRLTFLSDAKGAAEWQERVKAKLRKYRNNPAILMWVHSVNSFNGTNDQDPHYIGQPEKFFADGIGITNALPAGGASLKSCANSTRPDRISPTPDKSAMSTLPTTI